METIAKLIRIALIEASEKCVIDWHPDDEEDAPETFEAECEIEYQSARWPHQGTGDYYMLMYGIVFCVVRASSLPGWTSTRLDVPE